MLLPFECKLISKWERIGYVLKEALDMKWIWITSIQYSLHGLNLLYTGVSVVQDGTVESSEWPKEVVQCASRG